MSKNWWKALVVGLVLVFGIGMDQWTKSYAEDRLAGRYYKHQMVIPVPADQQGKKTVSEVLAADLTWTSPEDLKVLSSRWARTPDGKRLAPDSSTEGLSAIHLLHRDVIIVQDYFDFHYARNPGAAFSFMANADDSYRVYLLLSIAALAFCFIMYLIVKADWLTQRLSVFAYAMIAAGAMGNFIDRARFGYVIDFILWKYTDDYRWPAFNIADTLIVIGVGLLFIEMFREEMRERRAKKEGEEAPAEVA